MRRRLPLLLLPLVIGACIWLLWPVEAGSGSPVTIREDGVASPEAGLRTADGPALAGRTDPVLVDDAEPEVPSEGPDVAEPPARLPLRVTLVEAESGRIVSAPWALHPDEAEDAKGKDVPSDTPAFARTRSRETTLSPGAQGQVRVVARPDQGDRLVAWDDARFDVHVSTYATSLEAMVPLRSEADVRVVATAHDGAPVDRFRVLGFRVANRNVRQDLRTTPGAAGLQLYGVPFFRGRPLEVLVDGPRMPSPEEDVASEDVEDEEIEEEVLGVDEDGLPFYAYSGTALQGFGHDVARGRAVLPHAPFEPVVVRIRFGPEPEFGSMSGGMTFGRGIGCGRRRKIEARGDAVLRVFRRDGRPAVGARVALGYHRARVGAEGLARFEGVPAGAYTARLREPGLVSNTVSVDVQPDAVTRATLREAEGGSFTVRVLAPDGLRAPFATVEMPRAALWADLRGGVQRIDPYTDERGERTFEHVTPGEHRLVVRWAGIRTTAVVEVGEGHTPITIRIPAPSSR